MKELERLKVAPDLPVFCIEDLAAVHFQLTKRSEMTRYLPQKDYIRGCKENHPRGRDYWRDDVLAEIPLTTGCMTAKEYVEQAKELDYPYLEGEMQAKYR